MRVLYLSHTSHVSGAERSLLDLLRALPNGVSPVVACPEGDLAHAVRALGVPVWRVAGTDASLRLHPWFTARAVGGMASESLRLRRVVRRLRIDLVHANSVRAGLVAAACRSLGGPPAVVHVRDRLPPSHAARLSLAAIERGADALIANSHWTAAALARRRGALVRVMHNAVDLERFTNGDGDSGRARAELGLDDAGPVLGVVGQLTPWKGQADAIRILVRLLERYPDARLVLVGSAKFLSPETRHDNRAYVRELHELVADHGLERQVRFTGEREDVPTLLAAFDLLLVPSWEEPFGRVVLEAMAARVPVVATARGGPAEVLRHHEDGVLLAPSDPERWATVVSGLLERRDVLRAMARVARARVVTEFGLAEYARAMIELYSGLLDTEAAGAANSSQAHALTS